MSPISLARHGRNHSRATTTGGSLSAQQSSDEDYRLSATAYLTG